MVLNSSLLYVLQKKAIIMGSIFDLKVVSRGQGTIEYLVTVAVIVVISLLVVAIVSNNFDSFSGISSVSSKISGSSGLISISEAVVDSNGNGLVNLGNNSGGLLIITRVCVGGVDSNYSDVSLSQGDSKTFSLSDINSGCSCVGFEGKTKTCEVVVYAESEYGLEKQFTTSVSVDCVPNATPINPSVVVQPNNEEEQQDLVYSITLNEKDSFSHANLTGFDVDCNVNAYDLTGQNSPLTIDFNSGSYSCVFSESGYDSFTKIFVADSNKSLSAYLDQIGIDYIHLSNCNTLSVSDQNYILDNDISSGGVCLTIGTDNIRINGNGFTVTGNIDANKSGDRAYTDLNIINAIVDGSVLAVGADNAGGVGFVGGNINALNSTITTIITMGGQGTSDYSAGAAGAVTATDSAIETITTTGGAYTGSSYCSGHSGDGGAGGKVTLANSTITTITATGGSANQGCYGGLGGVVTINDSTITTINSTGGAGYQHSSAGGLVEVTDSNVITITASGGGAAGSPGVGGTVTITNSTVTAINTIGGSTFYSTGGLGGTVTITNSNISTIIASGGNSGPYYPGGAGGNVTFDVCPTPIPNVNVSGGTGAGGNGADGTIDPSDCHNP